MFSVHLNTAKPWYLEKAPLLAEQTLELGGPSTLVLRLAPDEGGPSATSGRRGR
jgi:hypothetical protein